VRFSSVSCSGRKLTRSSAADRDSRGVAGHTPRPATLLLCGGGGVYVEFWQYRCLLVYASFGHFGSSSTASCFNRASRRVLAGLFVFQRPSASASTVPVVSTILEVLAVTTFSFLSADKPSYVVVSSHLDWFGYGSTWALVRFLQTSWLIACPKPPTALRCARHRLCLATSFLSTRGPPFS